MNCERIALTCAPGGENHTGNQFIGKMPEKGSGLTFTDLTEIANKIVMKRKTEIIQEIEKHDVGVELLDLNKLCGDNIIDEIGGIYESEKAGVLIVRNWVENTDTQNIYDECILDEWDKKYLDPNKYREEIVDGEKVRVRGKVLNKHARSNICYVEDRNQTADYLNGKGTIVDLNEKTCIKKQVDRLRNLHEKLEINVVEGNRYFDLKKTGIGFHGDTERAIVMCLSIGGGGNYPMRWQWFKGGFPVGNFIDVKLNDGDLYIMSEKSVGMDWKLRSKYTLRHAAGAEKYTTLKKWEKRLLEKKSKIKK